MIKNNWDTLHEFRDWYISCGMPIMPPFKNAIFASDLAYGLCIYRSGQYQVELYITKPNTEPPYHSHPGVESSFMHLAGNVEFKAPDTAYNANASAYQYQHPNGNHHVLFGLFAELPAGGVHTAWCGKEGGAFLSFERWDTLIEPTSVTVNWVGDTAGPEHTNILDKMS